MAVYRKWTPLLLRAGLAMAAGSIIRNLTAVDATLVDSFEDSNTPGTLRYAVENAVESSTITFAPKLSGGTINLTNGQVAIGKSLTIDATSLPSGIVITGESNNYNRVFHLSTPGENVIIKNLAIKGGRLAGGKGGGILVTDGTLTLFNCTLEANSASTNNGDGLGGAIFNSSRLNLSGCTFHANTATVGGAVYVSAEGTANVTNCTFVGNLAANDGGALYNRGNLTNLFCTIIKNKAGRGGGIATAGGHTSLAQVIVAENIAPIGRDVFYEGGTVDPVGINLIGSNDTIGGIASSQYVGTPGSPIPAGLAELGFYGGPTQTMPPLRAVSRAINATQGNGIGFDQRGFLRSDGKADLGAAEAQAVLTVSNPVDQYSPPVLTNKGFSLREALSIALAADTISFQLDASAPRVISLTNSLVLSRDVTIDGGTSSVIIAAAPGASGPLLNVRATAFIRNLNLQDASNPGFGGAIFNQNNLTLTGCTISGNTAALGGAIYNGPTGNLSMTNCTLAHNTAVTTGPSQDGGWGGSIFNRGTARLVLTTISRNSALRGGGIYAADESILYLDRSIVAANTATLNLPGTGPDIHAVGSVRLIEQNLVGYKDTLSVTNGLLGAQELVLDPLLAPLDFYGGPTRTMPPLIGSPALDIANNLQTSDDQRGFPRPVGGKTDLGAFEGYMVLADAAWSVQEFVSSSPINSLADARKLVNNASTAAVFSYRTAVLNRHDPDRPGGGGYFPGDEPFVSDNQTPVGKLDRDDDDFVLLGRCVITVPEDDNYTFGFSADDGAELKILGAKFINPTSSNPETPAEIIDGALVLSGGSPNSDARAECFLKKGAYGLEFLTWESTGEAYCEVFAVRGTNRPITEFKLIGHAPSSQGSLTNAFSMSSWSVDVLKRDATSLASAQEQLQNYWNGALRSLAGIHHTNIASINFSDPQRGGGGHGFDQTPFPGSVNNLDDDYFSLGAHGALTINSPGEYTFCILSDNGVSLRIKGSRGWSATSPQSDWTHPQALADGMQLTGCCADVFGVTRLAARTYDLELIYNEVSGSAYLGVWIAPGRYDTFDPAVFRQLKAGKALPDVAPFALAPPIGRNPFNDSFGRAVSLLGFPAEDAASTDNASEEPGERLNLNLKGSLWWKWVAPEDGAGLFEANTVGSAVDTILTVWRADARSSLTDLVPIISDDDSGPNGSSRVFFNTQAGTNYYFQVGRKTGVSGPVRLRLLRAETSNISRETARILTGFPTSGFGNTAPGNDEAWFIWTAPKGQTQVRVDTIGSLGQARVAVYLQDSPPIPNGETINFQTRSEEKVYFQIVTSRPGYFAFNLTPSDPGEIASWPIIKQLDLPVAVGSSENAFTIKWNPGLFKQNYSLQQSFDLRDWTTVTNLTFPAELNPENILTQAVTNVLAKSQVFFRLLAQ